jgi:predicted ATPase
MWLHRARIEHFRCFEEVELDFRYAGAVNPFSAVVGPNGSGKSSLLEGISLALLALRGQPSGWPGGARVLLDTAWGPMQVPVQPGGRSTDDPVVLPRSLLVDCGWLPRAGVGLAFSPELWDAAAPFLGELRFAHLEGGTNEPRFLHQTESIGFDQLSAGQRSIITLFAQLLKHAAPDGLILIDEPESHLHPKWQRLLRPALRKLLPEAQFLVATHSPYIVEGLEPHEVFVLGDME